jgi:hypothetical protein
MWMLVKSRLDLDALVAVFGCFGAVFKRFSILCPELRNKSHVSRQYTELAAAAMIKPLTHNNNSCI